MFPSLAIGPPREAADALDQMALPQTWHIGLSFPRRVRIWVDLDKVSLSSVAKPMTIKVGVPGTLGGEVSAQFAPTEPLKFVAR
jgi:hypothetical protein